MVFGYENFECTYRVRRAGGRVQFGRGTFGSSGGESEKDCRGATDNDFVSLSIVDFDCGERPSAEEPKTTELGVVDILSDQIVPLLSYLDGKMTKYVEPELVESYVDLVRSRTRVKASTSVEVAKRVASLTYECAAKIATL